MSKSVPDLEQALALTSRGRARRPVEPHEDRPPRVMIAIHVDPAPGGLAPAPFLDSAGCLDPDAGEASHRPHNGPTTQGVGPRVNGRWKGRHSGQDGDHNM